MWCPGISAFIIKIIFYRKEKIIKFQRCPIVFILLGIFIPVFYLGISYAIYWLINPFAFTGQIYSTSITFYILAFLSSIITAMGEEIGWRGFLLPKMSEIFHPVPTVIICGLIWAVWHYPLLIAGLYQSGTPLYYQLPVFTLEVILITGTLFYLRMRSHSIWPAILLHASHNYIDQLICAPLTQSDDSAYFAGETGLITVVCIVIIVILLATKSSKNSFISYSNKRY
ncbi:hypothetical protein CG709_04235, partial [Lachnotalea glycerini]